MVKFYSNVLKNSLKQLIGGRKVNKKWNQEKFSTAVTSSDYIIGCRKGKISYMFEYSKKGWISRERSDLREENVKSAFYALAKKNVEDFRTLYHLLKKRKTQI